MAMTTTTKTLVDALPADPASSETSLANHASHHNAIHDALQEIYGIKRFVGKYTQSGSSAPVLVASLENTTGATLTPSYVSSGRYRFTFDSAVMPTDGKARVTISNAYDGAARILLARRVASTYVDVVAMDVTGYTADGNEFWLAIEIYP